MNGKQTLLGPFSRIEGDLEIRLEREGNQVQSAYITAPMFRGFEAMLVGRDAQDALAIAPRVCGICSVSQSVAARNALAQAAGVETPRNAQLVLHLMQAAENLSDLFAHGYLYFWPELGAQAFAQKPWYKAAAARFAPQSAAWLEALDIRATILGMLSPLAGKWPHSISMLPGGIAKVTSMSERAELLDRLGRVVRFLEQRTYGGPLEEFLELANCGELIQWAQDHRDSDLGFWLTIALVEGWERLGPTDTAMMSFGAYGGNDWGGFAPGFYQQGLQPLEIDQITEDLSSSWLEGPKEPLHPSQGVTHLGGEGEGRYSYNKAVRYGGQPVSVGSLSRQVIDGQALATSLYQTWGQGVLSRVLARWIEVARLTLSMRQWLEQLDLNQPFYAPGAHPFNNGAAQGLVEAARGSLGHFIEIQEGKLSRYQIVAPTSWNFSPRDQTGQPGPCEMALAGLTYQGDQPAPELWMVVRSFDPCMQCTVH